MRDTAKGGALYPNGCHGIASIGHWAGYKEDGGMKMSHRSGDKTWGDTLYDNGRRW